MLADYEERIKIIAADEKAGKIIEKKDDKLIDLVKANLENEKWVEEVEKIEDDKLRVRTTDKYIIVVKIEYDGTVIIIEEETDDGEPYPSLTLTQLPLEGTENEKIKIKAEAEVAKISKTKKVTKVRIIKPESMKQEKEYTEGGVIFEVSENGVYTFEAETNMGKTSRKTIEVNISKPESDIEITSEPITPRNTEEIGTQNGIAKGPINVKITFGDNNFIKQYKKETDENWTTVTGSTADFTVTENIAIFAKYSDGTNSFKTVTYNIQNVDNVSPNTFNVTETHTTNSITVGASTTDTASTGASSTIAGILRYEYRIYKNNAWGNWQTSNTFTRLTTGTYKVQAKAIDKSGNETLSSELANIILDSVSTADITISSDSTIPRNTNGAGTQYGIPRGPITISITYGNSNYTKQYKEETDTNWTTVSGSKASFTVTENVTIYARYFDGTNGFKTQGFNIQNVDNVAPTISSYDATVNKNVITATITATDTASEGASSTTAGILRYAYRIYVNNVTQGWQSSNKFTVSEPGTYKIEMIALDKAGNSKGVSKQVTVSGYTVTYNANGGSGAPESQTAISGMNLTLSSTVPTKAGYTFLGWSTSNTATTATYSKGATYTANKSATLYAVWKIDNVAPTAPTTSVTSRNTNTIIVNAKSTDSNGDKLTYKLYTKSASASGYTLSATSASTASGTAVNLTASNLSSYTVYTYYVTVSDGKAETTGTTRTTGTGCSGTGNTCYGPFSESMTCTLAYICSAGTTTTKTCYNTTSTKVVCGTYQPNGSGPSVTASCGHTKASVSYKCSGCGSITNVTSTGCTNATCSNYNTSYSNLRGTAHYKTQYVCSTHNYTGSSSSHTYTETLPCSHGYTTSHYHCSTHGYNGASSTHSYTASKKCIHDKSSQHSYCSHGQTAMHYPN